MPAARLETDEVLLLIESIQPIELSTYRVQSFVAPMAGAISLVPGTGSNPAFRRIGVDADSGQVKGVFLKTAPSKDSIRLWGLAPLGFF